MEILYLVTGIIVGGVITYFLLKSYSASHSAEINSLKNVAEQRVNDLSDQKQKLETEKDRKDQLVLQLTADLSRAKEAALNLEEKLARQKEDLEELQQRFQIEFRNIANEILEEKGKRFTEQNRTNLDEILKPLSEKIKDFEKKVDDTHKETIKENASLKEQIGQLHKLNQTIGEEAKNLTSALKGQTKTQGNWGEVILLSILEKSGLVRDREYLVQESHQTEEGSRQQPDVIIALPDGKRIIIDSKVSLNSYETFCSTDDEPLRKKALAEHLTSIRNHLKGLSEKNYQNLYELKGLDFVFMFVPIEPALTLAMQTDPNLYNEGYDKNIVIVSPSILMAALRLVANIWRQENQNKNAEEIAKQGADLYDKFVGFIEDMIIMGRKLDDAKKSYEESMKKLSTGTGNLVRRSEKMKELGLKTSKSLPSSITERSE